MSRIAGRFSRVGPRRRVRQLVSGLLSDLPRKNCWTLAEHAGDATPDGMQHLLHRAKWDADAIRDDIGAYVVEHLRDTEAVLVVDETGDLKKGTATVGVQRQYTGTAGRVENAQVAVISCTPPPADTPPSTEPCMCRARGPRHRTAAGARASPTAWLSPPSPSLPPAWSSGPWTREHPRAGSRATRSTATTRTCGPPWNIVGPATSWQCPAPTPSSRPPVSSRRRP